MSAKKSDRDTDDGTGVEPLSDIAKDVAETLAGKHRRVPGERFPEQESRKGDAPVDDLE